MGQPPSGGCVLKPLNFKGGKTMSDWQPPSGGCVLKPVIRFLTVIKLVQPPSGGCVLKQYHLNYHEKLIGQPPSGGCVLKQDLSETSLSLL